MDVVKPWYLSRTVWASVITVLSAFAAMVGLPVDGMDGGAMTDLVLQAVTAVSGVIAILGRLQATARLN